MWQKIFKSFIVCVYKKIPKNRKNVIKTEKYMEKCDFCPENIWNFVINAGFNLHISSSSFKCGIFMTFPFPLLH